MIDSTGVTIADTTLDTVAVQNIEEEAQNDPSLGQLAALHTDMRAGNSGYGPYEVNGATKYLAYAPVDGTNGWSIAVTAPAGDFLGTTYQSTAVIAVLLVVILAAAVFLSIRLAKRIGDPIRLCAERLSLVDEGDLSSPVPEYENRDETGTLSRATAGIVTTLQELIGDVDYLLSEMSNGNFDVRSRNYDLYRGDYTGLLQSVRNINITLSETLQQINQAADQVSAGAEQVSSGAQALAQGATEQASAVEELSATVAEIAQSAQENAKNSDAAMEQASAAGQQVTESVAYMEEMVEAMDHISQSSEEISKIINTIENIAFQTNILALNAAVEAARAGQAGKGFAVVADEVRSLASKSAEAAKGTGELIDQCLQAIENGNQVAGDTATALNSIKESVDMVAAHTGEISDMAAEQSDMVLNIHNEIESVSQVVQMTAASAQESSSTSRMLQQQAEQLRALSRSKTGPASV